LPSVSLSKARNAQALQEEFLSYCNVKPLYMAGKFRFEEVGEDSTIAPCSMVYVQLLHQSIGTVQGFI
jgi:hypothetical protein